MSKNESDKVFAISAIFDLSMEGAVQNNLADQYFVDDQLSAARAGTRLNGILVKLNAGEPLSLLSQNFLATRGFKALYGLASGSINWVAFKKAARMER